MQTNNRRGCLNGVRVLDLCRNTAGLFGGMILADLGAEVIKLEPRQITPRTSGRFRVDQHNMEVGVEMRMLHTYRNKKSLVLDLKSSKGLEVFYELVKVSDVVLDNYRPGVLEGMKMDYNTLSQMNPRIICASVTGFGSSGPYARRPGYDHIGRATAGLMSLSEWVEGEKIPYYSPVAFVDMGTGMFTAHGVMAALYDRERTGVGQRVEASLLDTSLAFLYLGGVYFLNSGVLPARMGHRPDRPLSGLWETSDSCILAMTQSQEQQTNLLKALGLGELLSDPRFDTQVKRAQNWKELNELTQGAFRRHPTEYWKQALLEADVPFAPVNTLEQAFADPHVQSREMVVTIPYDGKQYKIIGSPIRHSKYPRSYTPSPTYGQHTEEVLSQVLKYTPQKIHGLKEEGTI